jgi:hypothetical protein
MIGIRKTHDDHDVVFFEDRFDHAFRTSSTASYSQFKKDILDRKRAARVRWIGQVINGSVEGVVYYNIPDRYQLRQSSAVRINRLYVLWEERYLVWLEPKGTKAWKFSTAYVAHSYSYIRKLTLNLPERKIKSRD